MALSAEDRFAITDLISMHGHLCDRGDFDGLRGLFTADVTYDVTALGGGVFDGLDSLRAAALALGDANPVAHHVTNVVVTEAGDGTVRALSKGFGVLTDGSVNSVTYEDAVERDRSGWRIAHRVVRPRRTPLRP